MAAADIETMRLSFLPAVRGYCRMPMSGGRALPARNCLAADLAAIYVQMQLSGMANLQLETTNANVASVVSFSALMIGVKDPIEPPRLPKGMPKCNCNPRLALPPAYFDVGPSTDFSDTNSSSVDGGGAAMSPQEAGATRAPLAGTSLREVAVRRALAAAPVPTPGAESRPVSHAEVRAAVADTTADVATRLALAFAFDSLVGCSGYLQRAMPRSSEPGGVMLQQCLHDKGESGHYSCEVHALLPSCRSRVLRVVTTTKPGGMFFHPRSLGSARLLAEWIAERERSGAS